MIFIDCDDTLVRWLGADRKALDGKHPYGGGAEAYEPNPFVMAAAWLLRARGVQGPIFVWSGGGKDYATRWAQRLFPDTGIEGMAKDPSVLRPGDVVVDDGIEFRVPDGVFVKTPDEFAEWVLS